MTCDKCACERCLNSKKQDKPKADKPKCVLCNDTGLIQDTFGFYACVCIRHNGGRTG